MALALMVLAANHGTRLFRGFDGFVGGVIVINVDGRSRQRRAEVGDHLGDGALLVVARHQNRHVVLAYRGAFSSELVGRHYPLRRDPHATIWRCWRIAAGESI